MAYVNIPLTGSEKELLGVQEENYNIMTDLLEDLQNQLNTSNSNKQFDEISKKIIRARETFKKLSEQRARVKKEIIDRRTI